MGQQGAGRGELRSWQTMNEDRERYNYRAGNPTANNYVPSISSARNRSFRGTGRGRVASAATAAAPPAAPRASAQPPLGMVPGFPVRRSVSPCDRNTLPLAASRPAPRPRPPPLS
ncbi:Protein of unknown function [Gryllus bimaculatus]|nr:Protein of unknown function [Gryllus bimaculatus]